MATVSSPNAAWAEIERIVGAEHVRTAASDDMIDCVMPHRVTEPGTPEEIAQVLAAANNAGIRVAARGGGTKMGWGNPPRGIDLVVAMRRMNHVLEHAWADMTATVEAGCSVAELQRTLAEHGQRLALDPLWPEKATIGGVLAANDSGSLRVRFGSLRDLIIGVTLVLADGTLAKSGGKVVKNVAGYDLPKLATGSLGTLGIITQAIFRLHPLPYATQTLSFSASSVARLNELAVAVLGSKLAYTGLQIRAESAAAAQIDVRFAGPAEGITAQAREVLGIAAKFASPVEPSVDVWGLRESLFTGNVQAIVIKASTVPADIHVISEVAEQHASGGALRWKLIAQGVGVGLLRAEAESADALIALLTALRTELGKRSGSAVVLACPAEMKSQVDSWGQAGDALPLMRRMKDQFDPKGTLNPGRFVGGI